MKIELPPISPEQRTPLVDTLLALIDLQQQRLQQLEELVLQLREEIAILKGQKPRPNIAPRRLETPPNQAPSQGQKKNRAPKGSKNPQLQVDREERLCIPDSDLPDGAVFKGFEPYLVQELRIQRTVTRYWRARYELPQGGSIRAPLPNDVSPGGHYGRELLRYLLYQYHHHHVTQPLLLEELHQHGIAISAGQLNSLWTENQEVFHPEKAELLAAGLQGSSYLGTDATGARHQGRNG